MLINFKLNIKNNCLNFNCITDCEQNNNSSWVANYLVDKEKEIGLGNFEVRKAEALNVLLVGRSQSGKSTLLKTIINPYSATDKTGFSLTRRPEMHMLILSNTESNKSYQLNIIDTPGLKDNPDKSESKAMTDMEIFNLLTVFMQNNITKLHLVCLVSIAGKTHQHDIETFNSVIKYLGKEFSPISMLILTHCDEYNEIKVDEYEKQIQTHEHTKEIYEYCQLKFMRVGALDKDQLDKMVESLGLGKVKPIVENRVEANQNFRTKFLSTIIKTAGDGIHISKIQDLIEDNKTKLKFIKDEIRKLTANNLKFDAKSVIDNYKNSTNFEVCYKSINIVNYNT